MGELMKLYTTKFLLIAFVSLWGVFQSYAQEDQSIVALADEMYNYGDRKDALDVYLQAIAANKDNLRANYMAGICYIETIHRERAFPYLQKAYELNPAVSQDILLQIGRSLQFANKFDEAISYYQKYRKEVESRSFKESKQQNSDVLKLIDRKIQECETGKELLAHPTEFRLESIGQAVNSEYAEYSPALNSGEDLIYFTSRRQGSTGGLKDRDNEFFEDVYFSKKINGQWQPPQNVGKPINTEFHEACISLSADGKQLFLFREENGGDIYMSTQDAAGKWTEPKPIEGKINSKYYEPSMSISQDGKFLFFVSNRPGGTGGLDIYLSQLDSKGKWGEPTNLGGVINTTFNEESPFFDQSTGTLYFSSAGHKGMGGYDIFKSDYDSTNGQWGAPENLGYPVNTSDDDLYYQVAMGGEHGYCSSVRDIGVGEKDIYLVRIPPKKVEPLASEIVDDEKKNDQKLSNNKPVVASNKLDATKPAVKTADKPAVAATQDKKPSLIATKVKGRITDKNSGLPIVATIQIADKSGKVLKTVKTNENGLYVLDLKSISPGTEYSVTFNSDGYMYEMRHVLPNQDGAEVLLDMSLNKLQVGMKKTLRNIYFDYDKTTLKPASNRELDEVAAMLKKNTNMTIEVGGHTDNYGSQQYNLNLSQKRADAVASYLISKGIATSRIKSIGFGEKFPLASNDDESEGRELNRRTEFKILGK